MKNHSSLSTVAFCIALAACGGGGGSSQDSGSRQDSNSQNNGAVSTGNTDTGGTSSPTDSSGTSGQPPVAGGGTPDGGTTTSPPVNGGPSASISVVKVSSLTVTLDGSASAAQSGSIRSYTWDFGDGQSATGATVTHTFAAAGEQKVTLTVVDSNGMSNSVLLCITVNADIPATPQGDPYYSKQWHLKNTGQAGNNGAVATAGEDINVEPVWNSCNNSGSCKGEGITIAVVDTGIETSHEDLKANISPSLKSRLYPFDGNPIDGEPTPASTAKYSDAGHGTYVAGLIAARDDNGVGVRGVAPRASLVGYRLLTNMSTSNMVDAMTYQATQLSISNNSWLPSDDNTAQLAPGDTFWQGAVDTGLTNGRHGRGIIYVFSGGNGALNQHRSDYSGTANYKGVIAVASTNANGVRSRVSSPGANLWISAPGGDGCDLLGVTTTDLSGNAGMNNPSSPNQYDLIGDKTGNYTQCMTGTSAAAPIVSGVVALILQANPDLSWRDVRAILASTARKNDASDAGWSTNAGGFHINDKYGFGVVNAAAAVTAARTWTLLPAQKTFSSAVQSVSHAIPDNATTGITESLTLNSSGIGSIEWIDVTLTVDHPYSGDLQIVLTSPSGTQSVLAETHDCKKTDGSVAPSCEPFDGWRFGVARLLGERADGTWKLSIRDGKGGNTGTLKSWQITAYGH